MSLLDLDLGPRLARPFCSFTVHIRELVVKRTRLLKLNCDLSHISFQYSQNPCYRYPSVFICRPVNVLAIVIMPVGERCHSRIQVFALSNA